MLSLAYWFLIGLHFAERLYSDNFNYMYVKLFAINSHFSDVIVSIFFFLYLIFSTSQWPIFVFLLFLLFSSLLLNVSLTCCMCQTWYFSILGLLFGSCLELKLSDEIPLYSSIMFIFVPKYLKFFKTVLSYFTYWLQHLISRRSASTHLSFLGMGHIFILTLLIIFLLYIRNFQ